MPPWLSRKWLVGDVCMVAIWAGLAIGSAIRQDWWTAIAQALTGAFLSLVYFQAHLGRYRVQQAEASFDRAAAKADAAYQQNMLSYNIMMASKAAQGMDVELLLKVQQN